MKRYALFYGVDYYPSAGWGDFRCAFDTLDEAKSAAPEIDPYDVDWWQIVDMDQCIVVLEG